MTKRADGGNMSFTQIWNNGIISLLTYPSGSVALTALILSIISSAVISYLLGSINPAIIISKKLYGDDIRNHGSGNAGMTNVMRTYGKKMAALTFAGDFLKAVIASLIGRFLLGFIGAYISGFTCFLGHIFPCFYKFKGGKGIVTACAMILMTDWKTLIVLVLVFVLIVALTRYISLGSIIGLMFYPIVLDRMWYVFGNGDKPRFVIIFAIFVMLLGVWGHRKNIKRMLNKTENKFSFKVKDKKPAEAGENENKED